MANSKRTTKRKLPSALKAWNEKVKARFVKGRKEVGKKYTYKMAMMAAKREKK